MAENRVGDSQFNKFVSVLRKIPDATAVIQGSSEYPNIRGRVWFYQTELGALVVSEIFGLPAPAEECKSPVFAFHIHSGNSCSGNEEDPFTNSGTHYNPANCSHPFHSGDMPPLFGNNGYAFEVYLTDRFSVKEVIGKTVIIHLNPDDFTTQPSGNAGEKIACGEIKEFTTIRNKMIFNL